MARYTTDYIRKCQKCLKCLKSKTTKLTKTPLAITETPEMVCYTVIVDTIGPFPKSEQRNEYGVTLICD